jgi:hypothetical protein
MAIGQPQLQVCVELYDARKSSPLALLAFMYLNCKVGVQVLLAK